MTTKMLREEVMTGICCMELNYAFDTGREATEAD
jgi:hypothetical protein